ncbi:MAG: AmmeMemoRadiSam system protein A [Candidatus Hydrogenedentes bacterium]|nr:AmmeMemoRadiSam system protein A [Candidatus Hydrogenedentota bacterium]
MRDPNESLLTHKEQRSLLRIARTALETCVRKTTLPDLDRVDSTPAMRENRASFVTLRETNGDLRGCIGSTVHASPLLVSVRDNAIRSATKDPRFDPVSDGELPRLTIEISVLLDGDDPATPFRRLSSIDEIVIGRDGLYLEFDGNGGGLLLPQVASVRNWDVHQFLTALCQKSGLALDAWQDSRTVLHRFSAEVFCE